MLPNAYQYESNLYADVANEGTSRVMSLFALPPENGSLVMVGGVADGQTIFSNELQVLNVAL